MQKFIVKSYLLTSAKVKSLEIKLPQDEQKIKRNINEEVRNRNYKTYLTHTDLLQFQEEDMCNRKTKIQNEKVFHFISINFKCVI